MLDFHKILKEINLKLKDKYPLFNGAYFFGSRIKGNYNNESDYDAAFVFDAIIDNKLRNDVINIVYDFELANDIVIDSLVFNVDDILNPKTPFRNNVKNEGYFLNA